MKRNNKALYELIMRNVSKQVKKALNENNNQDPEIQKMLNAFDDMIGNSIILDLRFKYYNTFGKQKFDKNLKSEATKRSAGHVIEACVLNTLIDKGLNIIPQARNNTFDFILEGETSYNIEIKSYYNGDTSNITFTENLLNELSNDNQMFIFIDYIVESGTILINDITYCSYADLKAKGLKRTGTDIKSGRSSRNTMNTEASDIINKVLSDPDYVLTNREAKIWSMSIERTIIDKDNNIIAGGIRFNNGGYSAQTITFVENDLPLKEFNCSLSELTNKVDNIYPQIIYKPKRINNLNLVFNGNLVDEFMRLNANTGTYGVFIYLHSGVANSEGFMIIDTDNNEVIVNKKDIIITLNLNNATVNPNIYDDYDADYIAVIKHNYF